ncbi:MFS transporter, partial [Pseudomonas aeruginosa]
ALYLAAYAVGQFMWGVFADRFSTRVGVLGGVLTSARGALVVRTFASLPMLAACIVVQGLARSTGWTGLAENSGGVFATDGGAG